MPLVTLLVAIVTSNSSSPVEIVVTALHRRVIAEGVGRQSGAQKVKLPLKIINEPRYYIYYYTMYYLLSSVFNINLNS